MNGIIQCLAFFVWLLLLHLCCSICQFSFLFVAKGHLLLDTPHFVYPLLVEWTFWLFLLLVITHNVSDHSCTNFYVDEYVIFLRYIPKNDIARSDGLSFEEISRFFSKVTLSFTFPLSIQRFWFLYIFSILAVMSFCYSYLNRYKVVSDYGFDLHHAYA